MGSGNLCLNHYIGGFFRNQLVKQHLGTIVLEFLGSDTVHWKAQDYLERICTSSYYLKPRDDEEGEYSLKLNRKIVYIIIVSVVSKSQS